MYAVVENTPGYLPENDDPPVFDQFQEALNYLIQYRNELHEAEWAWENVEGEEFFCLEISEIVDGGFSYFDRRRSNDLGRVVEIVPYEED